MPKILFTGGGSAGHVTPNLAIIERLLERDWDIHYVGSYDGIEKKLVAEINIPYHSIATGKLRRYFSWKNFLTPFQVLKGVFQAIGLCRKLKPDVVFSKGGFVAFPIVFAAWLNRIPVIVHEADITPGLTNKLSIPFAKTVCVSFPEAEKYYKNKVHVTGIPIRKALFEGQRDKGLAFCHFNSEKPVILVFGGSLGAMSVNKTIRECLPELLPEFQVVHICGANKVDASFDYPSPASGFQPEATSPTRGEVNIKEVSSGYFQLEFVSAEMADLFACADLVISRAGANSVYELLSLKKPHILIPLPTTGSRGDQIVNAKYYKKAGLSYVIPDETLTPEKLIGTIKTVMNEKDEIKDKLAAYPLPKSVDLICEMIEELV